MKQWRYDVAAILYCISGMVFLIWIVTWIPLLKYGFIQWVGWVNFISQWVSVLTFFLAFAICDPVSADEDRIRRERKKMGWDET